ncbi:CsbD family protein [Enterococcus faecalis]|nr:CsbD family protein [Enterococcus faecalis]
MNANKNSVKGKVKEVTGEIVGNKRMSAEGSLNQVVGASKEVLKDLKCSVSGITESKTADKVSGKVTEIISTLTSVNG